MLIFFYYISRHAPHVIFLQETYLHGSRVMALIRVKIASAYHSTFSTYARGTSILLSKMAPVTVKHLRTDPLGCFVIVIMEFGR